MLLSCLSFVIRILMHFKWSRMKCLVCEMCHTNKAALNKQTKSNLGLRLPAPGQSNVSQKVSYWHFDADAEINLLTVVDGTSRTWWRHSGLWWSRQDSATQHLTPTNRFSRPRPLKDAVGVTNTTKFSSPNLQSGKMCCCCLEPSSNNPATCCLLHPHAGWGSCDAAVWGTTRGWKLRLKCGEDWRWRQDVFNWRDWLCTLIPNQTGPTQEEPCGVAPAPTTRSNHLWTRLTEPVRQKTLESRLSKYKLISAVNHVLTASNNLNLFI